MKKILFFISIISLLVAGFTYIGYENKRIDNEYIQLMESKDSFTDEEIHCLYHWMNPGAYDDHGPSKRFIELYNQKIKDL